ncbi:pyridoxal-phosphate-dependent aminotransferase family protein [Clostridium perfringens]|uniref:pyridoxal-phosphate-dependent aminotransferase family protein n=1 Tax=Clostridium perfringens TaxID=1502 RepID=UPI0010F0000E|nr:alanine--glyoxylate aminotransferase family protein [Clostridium perfringens]MCR1962964.1 alanine--glyoxylate aminotransferase family protein [Clostridium perfringens]MDB2046012.1 alanine--glyoxylate aminotransferase family protein [Clostridium perfringens]MDB2058590.1 alanine--glyoxylate aminotransferase family protein [Clostridium perfringens]QPR51808.1 alanine--glyoxylate aminotransferase family protein [Clostridium perfringens]VTQ54768.1 class V aminotransferase [Clostridium perfringens
MNCNKTIYTPGPTNLRENVRRARALKTTNPDVDLDFVEFYKETCDRFGEIINTKNDCYILSGEGILGLEAACASLTEKGDKVLVLDNGLYGRWFDGFVNMYGGEVTYFSGDYTKEIDVEALSKFLEKNNDFKYATVVHCDTPTGILNPVDKICPLLKSYGILTVVDSVSAMVGEEFKVDKWQIDIALGGSQKAFSAEPGLTMVSISDDARKVMENRETSIIGFYCNLNIWKNYYKDKWFPYTMPISDIISLRVAIDNILEEGKEKVIERHRKIGEATRKAVKEYGLDLFLKNGYSNTVTAVKIPEEIGALNLRNHLNKKYNVLMSTSLDKYENKLLRIGHMGENANIEDITYVLNAIDKALKDLGFSSEKQLDKLFIENI